MHSTLNTNESQFIWNLADFVRRLRYCSIFFSTQYLILLFVTMGAWCSDCAKALMGRQANYETIPNPEPVDPPSTSFRAAVTNFESTASKAIEMPPPNFPPSSSSSSQRTSYPKSGFFIEYELREEIGNSSQHHNVVFCSNNKNSIPYQAQAALRNAIDASKSVTEENSLARSLKRSKWRQNLTVFWISSSLRLRWKTENISIILLV